MTRKRLWLPALLSWLLLALLQQGACLPVLCQSDDDCANGSPSRPHCHYARCQACVEDRHCQAGQVCHDGRCLAPGEVPPQEEPSELPSDGGPADIPKTPDEPGQEGKAEKPPSQCPDKCSKDADCGQCGKKIVCFQGRCIEPSCPSSCTDDLNCQLCPSPEKSCLRQPDCTEPDTCPGQCGDPSCNPHGCYSDDDCRGCSDGQVFCDSDETGTLLSSCTNSKCPEYCSDHSECEHCANGNICRSDSMVCEGWLPCQTDADCKARPVSPPTPFCNKSDGKCYLCRDDNDCKSKGRPRCHPTSKRCVACLGHDDCAANGQKCDVRRSSPVCVECLSDSDCSAGSRCQTTAGYCYAPTGQRCDTSGKTAPRRCASGAACTLLAAFGSASTFCLKSCRFSSGSNACTEGGTSCVQTSSSKVLGHCLRSQCSKDSDCHSAFPDFVCKFFSETQGRVCGPPLPGKGIRKLGDACTPGAWVTIP